MAPPPELVIALDAAAISSRTNSTAAVRRPDDPETGLIAVSSASSLSHGNGSTASGGANGNRTLYLGNLHPFVTEATLQEVFSGLDGITELKVIKDKATGMSAGYGFAKFVDQAFAQVALDRVNKCILFGQDLRINWAFQKEQVGPRVAMALIACHQLTHLWCIARVST